MDSIYPVIDAHLGRPTKNSDRPIGLLTKREYFAIMAMQGLMAGLEPIKGYQGKLIQTTAVEIADALLEELNKKVEQNGTQT